MGNARRQREPGREGGFSLIELLIVVALILIMAAVALPNLAGYLRLYKIRGAAQQVAGELQQARAKAIMGNVNRGITFAVADADSYRWIQEDALDAQPAPANPYTGTLFTLPTGIRFLPQGGGSGSIRFNRLGAMCLPASPGCGAAFPNSFCQGSESAACGDAPAPANTYFITTATTQLTTVTLVEVATNLRRTVQISPGGRVLVQP